MSRLSGRVVAVTLALSLTGVGVAQARPSLAVLGVEAIDDSGDAAKQNETTELARLLTEALRARAESARNAFEPASSTRDLVEVKLLDCPDDADLKCMSKVGSDLGAKRLIYGSIKRLREGGFAASLRFINVETRVSERTVADKLPTDATNPAVLKKAASKYFSSLSGVASTGEISIALAEALSGTVVMDRSVSADLIDGTALFTDVPAGSHSIEITVPGYQKWTGSIDVDAGTRAKLDAELTATGGGGPRPIGPDRPHKRPGGIYRVLFWSSLVGTAAGAAGFTITGLQVRSAEDDKEKAILASQSDADPSKRITTTGDACSEAEMKGVTAVVDVCDTGRSKARLTNILIGATAVFGLASAFFYYKGYIAAPSAESSSGRSASRSKRPKSRDPRFRFGPELYGAGSGAGLAAEIEF